MPNLSNILNDSDEMSIPVGDDENLTIEYYPSRLTPKLLSQIQHYTKLAEKTAGDEEKQKEIENKVYALLLSFFKSWNMEDEVPCGKCDACKTRLNRESREREIKAEEEEALKQYPPAERENFARFDHIEPGEDEECISRKIVTLPLSAESLDNLPYWLFKAIIEKFINPNQTAPKRKKRN
jgi:hypothetical protein